jgi:2'-5' RNA ligase
MTEQSAIFVPVGSAERAVDKYRKKLDPAHICGIPAHITILFPFVPPEKIQSSHLQSLEEVFRATSPFDFVLSEVRWFDTRVVYLAPGDPGPFVEITTKLMGRFPDYPPYGGAYDDIVPHVCVGESEDLRAMRTAASRVAKRLPIAAQAHEAWLMTGNDSANSWSVRRSFRFGQ